MIILFGRSKRKIIKVGDSRGITLPPDWLNEKNPTEVHVVYDNLLVVFDNKEDAEKLCERFIEKAIDDKMTIKEKVV